MGATAAISSAVIAAAGTTATIVNSNKARDQAQAGADAQAKAQANLIDQQKAKEKALQDQKAQATVVAGQKLEQANAGGYSSTISTSPVGLAGPGVTGGQKTLLGG